MAMGLDRYDALGRAGLKVSRLALGTITFASDSGRGADRETARALFDAYVDAGCNFFDTADIYTGGALTLRRYGASLELATLAALALATPTLFCGLHSPRHFLETLAQLELDWRHGVVAAAPLTASTLGFAALGTAVLLQRGIALDEATLATVFIGLAALAVPHMLLVERFWTRPPDQPPRLTR